MFSTFRMGWNGGLGREEWLWSGPYLRAVGGEAWLWSGPYLRADQRGPGPGRQISSGGILKKSRLKYGMRGKKGCPRERNLTFKNRASYIQDRHTATLQTPHFIYSVNKYPY
jgi:hypothetical protein